MATFHRTRKSIIVWERGKLNIPQYQCGEDYGTSKTKIRRGHTLWHTSEFAAKTTITLLITFCCCEWFCRRETTSRQRTSFCLKEKKRNFPWAQKHHNSPWCCHDAQHTQLCKVWPTLGLLQCLALFRCLKQGHTVAFLVFPWPQKNKSWRKNKLKRSQCL